MARRAKRKDNVLSLYGAMPAHGVPDANIVSRLEDLLVLARDGVIGGLIVGWTDPSQGMHTAWEGQASAHDMIAMSAQLHHRIMCGWYSGLEDG